MTSFIRTILLYSTAAVATVILGLAVIVEALLGVEDKPGGLYDKVPRWWSIAVMRAVGVKVRVHGMENVKGGQPYIFASNHVSWFDVPSLATSSWQNPSSSKCRSSGAQCAPWG